MKIDKTIIQIFVFFNISCNSNDLDITGQWQGIHNNQKIIIVFLNNSECKILIDGKNNFVHGNYYIDFTKKPIPLTIKNIKEIDHPLHSIIKFINKNSIKMSKFSKRWKLRPTSFDQNKHFILNRIKS